MDLLISYQRFTLMVLAMLSIAACSPGPQTLPDDPSNEPVAITPSEPQADAGEEPVSEPAPAEQPINEQPIAEEPPSEREQILKLYDYIDPEKIVPTKPLEDAVIYYHKNKAKFKNDSVLSVIDFSQKSTQKRWYIINLKSGSVWNIHVSHGKGSDSNHDGYAEKFSNTSGSNATSLGFYSTAKTYQGSNGYSLKLDGLSSTNSKARSRAIVIHGASYVQDKAVIQGRSWGCPAVSMANRDKVINMLKGGSLIYAFK